jgi:hypothetical protein
MAEGGRRALDARPLDRRARIEQAGEIEASARAQEAPDLAGELLLALDPWAIGGRMQGIGLLLSQRRLGVSAQHLPQQIELEHTLARVL